MKFWHKISAAVAALALGAFGLAAPAAATGVYQRGCPPDSVCLYQWVGFSGPAGSPIPGWKSSFTNIASHLNSCLDLQVPLAEWANGTPVHDNSASIVVNGAGDISDKINIRVYDQAYCDSPDWAGFNAAWESEASDLHTVSMNFGINAYHHIHSIKIGQWTY